MYKNSKQISKKEKKVNLVNEIKNSTFRYLVTFETNHLSNLEIQKMRNNLRKNGIFSFKMYPKLWSLFKKVTIKGNLVGFLCRDNTALNTIGAYLEKNKVITKKYLKMGDTVPTNSTIEAGLTTIKAGPAYQTLEAVAQIRLQKSNIFIEKPLEIRKGSKVTPALYNALKILQKPLLETTLNYSQIIKNENNQYYDLDSKISDHILKNSNTIPETLTKVFRVLSEKSIPVSKLNLNLKLIKIINNIRAIIK